MNFLLKAFQFYHIERLTNFKRFKILYTFIWIISFIFAREVQSYPSFIGYGYTSCIVCHFNALGNGPLTDYGRALGATAIAAKPFYSPKADDQKLGDQAMFLLGVVPLPDILRLQANYRGMTYTTGIGNSPNTRFINMQIDGSAILKVAEDKLIAVINGGFVPQREGAETKLKPISREHYVSYAVTPRLRIYGGLLDPAYGIRIADHTAYSRTVNKVAQNDQVHGIMAHLGTNKSEFAVHGFFGNLFQDSKITPKGLSATFETDVAEKVRIGSSALFSVSSVRKRILTALHSRAGIGKGSSLLLETGFVFDTEKDAKTLAKQYIYTQSMTRLFRGFHFLFTGEYYTADAFRPNPRSFRVGPSIQYFPTSFLELRVDLWGERALGQAGTFDPPDAFQLLGQVHAWF